METKEYVKLAGIVVGGIGALVLLLAHPVYVIAIAIGAAVYFIGEYLVK